MRHFQLKFNMPAASPNCCAFYCLWRVRIFNFWRILAHKLQIILHCGWKKEILEFFISSNVTLLNIVFLLMMLSGTAAWQLVVYKMCSRGKCRFTQRSMVQSHKPIVESIDVNLGGNKLPPGDCLSLQLLLPHGKLAVFQKE